MHEDALTTTAPAATTTMPPLGTTGINAASEYAQLADEVKALFTQKDNSKSLSNLHYGRSIHNSSFQEVPRSAVNTVSRIVSAMPVPKVKKKKKKKASADDPDAPGADEPAEAGAEGGDGAKKKKKKKKAKKKATKSAYPEFPPMMRGPELTCDQAIQ